MSKAHWDEVWRTKPTEGMSWYQPHALRSLELIRRVSPPPGRAIIDVGGGASTLVDDLLDTGYRDVTVLDISPAALERSKARLGKRADQVRWIGGDLLDVELPRDRYDLWHDRAVFHFLTRRDHRARYVAQVRRALRPGGFVVIATFADDGPPKCSGLDVVRYSPEGLQAEFGGGFELIASEREEHRTPGGGMQAFMYCIFRA